MPEKANGPEVNAENPKPVSSPLTNDTSTNGPKQARATSQLIKNVDEEDPVVLPHSISKPSTAQLSKNPSIPRPSAWSRGPPQSSNSPSHSQLPTPTTPTVQTHSRRRRAFSGVSIKDGGSVSRDNVPASEQGAAMTFGSIDDISASISLSPAVAPPTKSDSVESFDTIEADSHVNEKSNGPMSNYQQSSPGTPNRRSVRLETPEQRNQRLAEEERARTENCEEPKKKKKKKKKKVPEHEQKEFEEKERTEGEELKRKEEKEKERIRKEEEEKERIRKEAEAIDVAPPELVDREVRGLLNELTIERFDPVSDQIIKWANKSKDEKDGRTLIQVIRLVLEKATDEASWSEMYARLCRKMVEQISNEVQDDWIRTPEGKPIAGGQLFRRYLLNKCQEDFERGWAADKVTIGVTKAATGGGDKEVMLHPEEHHTTQKAKRRGLGLVKLIGELFKLQMLTERIMHECVKKLLGDVNSPEEEEIEGLCQLLTTVGSLLDTQKARAHVDVYFMRMKELAKSSKVGPRTQSMLQDTIKLRERGWVTGNRTTREEEHLRWQINISPGGSQDGGNAAWHPSKAVGLSNFGKIGRKAGPPTMFGPGSVFAGGKAVNRRESLSQTGSSSNMFSMLQGAESEADRASEAQPTRKRLALLPRSKPVEQTDTQQQESSEDEEASTPAATAEMSDEAADKKIKEDSKEFFGVRNLDEAEVYFTALPAQHHYKLVDKLVSTAVESKEGDALLVSDLFARAVSKRLCGPASFEEGFTPVAEIIDDIAIDAPKALTLFATMIKGAGFDEERRSRLASKSMDGGKLLVLLS
ncbi:ARM repeat-containing protein [Macrolepiota fuliginosa MF-IS2]|uniref:ARM repeat-containing protein n=1 Tax=Macrolepiota fuliginosa MF-IS2 TaxID=1400762 RepID=A0A9P5XIF6_9AGAR|nr:ARM repeat-containing protein [Macrolepiota fuliginosa MF-IS2]